MSGIGTNLGKYLHPKGAAAMKAEGDVARAAREGGDAEQRRQTAQDDASRMAAEQYRAQQKKTALDEPEPVDNAAEDASEPSMGSKLAGRLRPGMFKMKPKTAQEQSAAEKKAESENAQNATRASLIGTRG